MSAAHNVYIMDSGAVVLFIRRLYAAFRHHRVGVAHTEFGNHHYFRARLVSLDSRRSARTAAADYQNVHVVIGIFKV